MRVELPFLAEGVEGGDVVQVLVKEGDQVTEGQSLIELETIWINGGRRGFLVSLAPAEIVRTIAPTLVEVALED